VDTELGQSPLTHEREGYEFNSRLRGLYENKFNSSTRTVQIEILHKAFSAAKGRIEKYFANHLPRRIRVHHRGEGSFCSETTLLRIIAGLETDYEGAVFLDGKKLNGPGLDGGVVFQEHRLLS
jgi:ABC-type polar amino acid transport system ATPase subunit